MPRSCKRNEIRNPVSGRCVKRTGKIGREILRSRSRSRSRDRAGECQTQVRNPRTNRCVNRDGSIGAMLLESGAILENCSPRIRNPATGRCVNTDSKLGQSILTENARIGALGNVIVNDVVYNRLGVNRRQPSPPRRVIQPIPEAMPISRPHVGPRVADPEVVLTLIENLFNKSLPTLKKIAYRLGLIRRIRSPNPDAKKKKITMSDKRPIVLQILNKKLMANGYQPNGAIYLNSIKTYKEWLDSRS